MFSRISGSRRVEREAGHEELKGPGSSGHVVIRSSTCKNKKLAALGLLGISFGAAGDRVGHTGCAQRGQESNDGSGGHSVDSSGSSRTLIGLYEYIGVTELAA